ncbi:hypothetical protein RP6297_01322 [Ralstonia pickettii]|nr:hypothetical protein RP6297_01322 [Ralstonia pickettii]
MRTGTALVPEAVSAVIDTIQMGVPIARVEFVDALAIRAINQYDKLTLPELPTLFFEFHGSEHGVQEQAETVQQIAAEHKGQGFEWATRPEDRSRLWNARHNAYFAFLQLKPGCRAVTTDVCVPISRLAECVVETEKDLLASALQLPAPIVGHVGDGNFHVALLIDPNKPEELEEAERINQRIVARAGTVHGNCTGDDALVDALGLFQFFRLVRVDQQRNVEVAVAHVADDGGGQLQRAGEQVLLGLDHAFSQARDRHAHVGGDGAAARLELQEREVRVVSGVPQAAAVFGACCPFEALAFMFSSDLLNGLGLLLHAVLRAVKFEEQRRQFGQRELVVLVDRADGQCVDKLHARNRHAHLDGVDHSGYRFGHQRRARAHAVGPVKARFKGRMELADVAPPWPSKCSV